MVFFSCSGKIAINLKNVLFVCFRGSGVGMPTLPDKLNPYLQSLVMAVMIGLSLSAVEVCVEEGRGGWGGGGDRLPSLEAPSSPGGCH